MMSPLHLFGFLFALGGTEEACVAGSGSYCGRQSEDDDNYELSFSLLQSNLHRDGPDAVAPNQAEHGHDPFEHVTEDSKGEKLAQSVRLVQIDGLLFEVPMEAAHSKIPHLSGSAKKARERKSWQAVWFLTVMILVAICPILIKEGVIPFFTVVTYLACLSLVKMYVKEAMASGWAYPDTITAIHMLCTSIFAAAFERPKVSQAMVVLPISAVTGFSLLLNNQALVHAGVAFVSMVSACTPMFTFGFEICRGKRTFQILNAAPVAILCLGATFCIHGEKEGSVLALVLAAGGTSFRAMKSVWQHELLTVSMSPMQLLFWNGFWSFWISFVMMLPAEGFEGVRSLPAASSKAKINFLLSMCAACVLNCSQCYAVKQLGALMQSIAGNLNLVLVIVLSQAWLHEEVSMWQSCGTALLVGGTVLSKVVDRTNGSQQGKLVEKTALSGSNPPETTYSSTAPAGNAEGILHLVLCRLAST